MPPPGRNKATLAGNAEWKAPGAAPFRENPMVVYLAVPPSYLITGQNRLTIRAADTTLDDIRVGKIVLIDHPLKELLTQCEVEVTVRDKRKGKLLPARITIVNQDGILQPVSGDPGFGIVMRPGCIYTGSGKASFGLPGGVYTIYVNHGFEYGVDSARLVLKPGTITRKKLVISREVPTAGWISADTHIHTLTYSGHGDATAPERVLTIAGEGIELPVLTDHNVMVEIDSLARALGMRKYFTPVAGYEYTTPVGHFNVFRETGAMQVPDYRVNSWNAVAENLHPGNNNHIVILNHARDIHSGFRPFDPSTISAAPVWT